MTLRRLNINNWKWIISCIRQSCKLQWIDSWICSLVYRWNQSDLIEINRYVSPLISSVWWPDKFNYIKAITWNVYSITHWYVDKANTTMHTSNLCGHSVPSGTEALHMVSTCMQFSIWVIPVEIYSVCMRVSMCVCVSLRLLVRTVLLNLRAIK